ncbi:MAG TPA: DUF309 domain-containing protein [Deinococcales bacterium]|nr:DUF309 domain-containing protein [Deinococcales bacterium]
MSDPDPSGASPGLRGGAPLDLRPGLEEFDARRYWEAHEVWEESWQVLRGLGREGEREFLQSLILVAAALHRAVTSGSRVGGRLNLEKAERHARLAPESLGGVNLPVVLEAARAAIETGEKMPPLLASGGGRTV